MKSKFLMVLALLAVCCGVQAQAVFPPASSGGGLPLCSATVTTGCQTGPNGSGVTIIPGTASVVNTLIVGPFTVSTLPSAATVGANHYTTITDGSTSSDCTVGGGTSKNQCISNGSTWQLLGGGGSTYQLPFYVGAKCQSGQAFPSMSYASSNFPAAACQSSGTTISGTVHFQPQLTTQQSLQDHFTLPSTWSGSLSVNVRWRSTGTTNSVTWGIQTACIADGSTIDNPTFNTASTVAHAPQGTTLQQRTDTIGTITVTGCAVNNELYFLLYRATGDTMVADAELLSLKFF